MSNDGRAIWYSHGGDAEAEVYVGTRSSPEGPFADLQPVTIAGEPLIGRSPRYVAATNESFYAAPITTAAGRGWELRVVKNYAAPRR